MTSSFTKCLCNTFLKPICHLSSLQNSGVPEYRTTTNKCQWNEFNLIHFYIKNLKGSLCAVTQPHPWPIRRFFSMSHQLQSRLKLIPVKEFFPPLLYVIGFTIGLLLAKFRDLKEKRLMWYSNRSYCFELVWTPSPAANYLSFECFVMWWVPSKRDVMRTLTCYLSRIWRQLFALHRIDIDQWSFLITRINFNPGIDKKLHQS